MADLVSETGKANLPCQGEQLGVSVASGTVGAFKRTLIFWKTVCHCALDSLPPKDFSDAASADAESDLLMLKGEVCQRWARLHNLPPHLYFRRFIQGELERN